MPEINEWTFAADVSKTIQEVLADSPDLRFSEAKVEVAAGPGAGDPTLRFMGLPGSRWQLAEERRADPETQSRIVGELWKFFPSLQSPGVRG